MIGFLLAHKVALAVACTLLVLQVRPVARFLGLFSRRDVQRAADLAARKAAAEYRSTLGRLMLRQEQSAHAAGNTGAAAGLRRARLQLEDRAPAVQGIKLVSTR